MQRPLLFVPTGNSRPSEHTHESASSRALLARRLHHSHRRHRHSHRRCNGRRHDILHAATELNFNCSIQNQLSRRKLVESHTVACACTGCGPAETIVTGTVVVGIGMPCGFPTAFCCEIVPSAT